MEKEFLSTIAMVITVVGFYPYIYSIYQNKIKPHIFTWFIWGITTSIVFLAQLQDGGGAGAWAIGFSALITIFIAFLSYLKRTQVSINALDWVFLSLALSSIVIWYFTSQPLWAVVILTIADILGFGSTFKKSYYDPYSESLTFMSIFFTRNFVIILALENYSLTTLLFPVTVNITLFFLIIMIVYKRFKLK